jgi:hypothetical protein
MAPSNGHSGIGRVRVLDTQAWKERSSLEKHSHVISSVVFSPNGQSIASASHDGTVKLHPIPLGPARNGDVREEEPTPFVAAKPEANIDLHVPLKSRPDNLPRMKMMGVHAAEWIHFEPAGLRITIPTGFSGTDAHVGLHTGVALKGDFEASVNYEILKLPDAADAGPETGVTLSALRSKKEVCITGATRRIVENGHSNFAGWVTWFDRAGKPSDHKGKVVITDATTGRLRLVRTGGELFFYASKSTDEELVLLNQISIGEVELDELRLIGFTGGPRATLDARLWDLRIRTGPFARPPAIPADPAVPPDPADATNAGSHVALIAVAALGCAFALLAALALVFRLRRSRAKPASTPVVARKPASVVSTLTFSCSCGKPLKAKAGLAGKKLKCPGCGALVLVPGSHEK